jgi:hypothetical protein
MTQLTAQIGRWAAWAETVVGYLYLAGYVIFLSLFPVKPWTDVQAFASELGSPYFVALSSLQVLAFLQALLVLVLAIAVYDYAPPDRKILARLGIAFAVSFAVLSSMHYYIQWVGVRQSILRNDLTGLGLFVQFNFDSPISAANMLGWMLFYGLTTLCLAPIFGRRHLEAWIRWGFLINGAGCIASAVLLAFGQKWVFLFWTVVVSATWFVFPLLGVLFRRLQTQISS